MRRKQYINFKNFIELNLLEYKNGPLKGKKGQSSRKIDEIWF